MDGLCFKAVPAGKEEKKKKKGKSISNLEISVQFEADGL